MIIFGVAISNGFVALSGALLAQYQGFADVGMGIGMVVWGLASVIIGEALTGSRTLGLTIMGAIMGSVLFRLMVAVALRWGLSPNDLKVITAVFVFFALSCILHPQSPLRTHQFFDSDDYMRLNQTIMPMPICASANPWYCASRAPESATRLLESARPMMM